MNYSFCVEKELGCKMQNYQNNAVTLEEQQASIVRKMLGHYDTEPKFLAMMVPEFVQYQIAQKTINYETISSLEDEFNKETTFTKFLKELYDITKKYFVKFIESL